MAGHWPGHLRRWLFEVHTIFSLDFPCVLAVQMKRSRYQKASLLSVEYSWIVFRMTSGELESISRHENNVFRNKKDAQNFQKIWNFWNFWASFLLRKTLFSCLEIDSSSPDMIPKTIWEYSTDNKDAFWYLDCFIWTAITQGKSNEKY